MPAIPLVARSQNPEFTNLNQRIVQLVLASAARASVVERGVSGMRLPQDAAALEHVFAPMFRGSGTMARRLRRAFSRPGPALREIDFRDPRSVIEQAVARKTMKSVEISAATFAPWRPDRSPQEINDMIAAILRFRFPPAGSERGATTPPAGRKARELQLKLKQVRCVERVGWEATDWDGKDVILCGGVGFDSTLLTPPPLGSPSTAHFRKTPQFTVDTFDNDGDTRNFNPDKVFCKWDLSQPGPWPRGFIGIMALGEKDSGDEFPALLDEIWAMLSQPVLVAVSALVAAAVGAGLGAIIGTEAAPLVGTAIGAALGAVIGAIVGVIIRTLEDDILETSDSPVTLVLPSASDTMPGGGDTSDVYTAEYVRPGGSGIYNLDYYWQLVY